MNVASKELSQELYELSGWEVPDNINNGYGVTLHRIESGKPIEQGPPPYDLGYLLRKLPPVIEDFKWGEAEAANWQLKIWPSGSGYWLFDYEPDYDGIDHWQLKKQFKGSPEDAAAKLAIELFKQGVLTRGGDE